MVAAYLVGTRGTARQAVALGATVTVTHTAGVVAARRGRADAVAVRAPGGPVSVAEPRRRAARAGRRRGGAARPHRAQAASPPPPRTTATRRPSKLSARGLVAMGASAGLIPCPSALVVLLGAVAQHQIALGLLLIVAFSAGLAATLTALGLAVVWTTRAAGRLKVPRAGARGAADAVGDRDRRHRDPAHRAGTSTGRVKSMIRSRGSCEKKGRSAERERRRIRHRSRRMTVAHHAVPVHVPSLAAALGTLRARGLRISSARRLVLEALFAADGPVTAEEVAGGLGGPAARLGPRVRLPQPRHARDARGRAPRAPRPRPRPVRAGRASRRGLRRLRALRAPRRARRRRAGRHRRRRPRRLRVRARARPLPDRRPLPGVRNRKRVR